MNKVKAEVKIIIIATIMIAVVWSLGFAQYSTNIMRNSTKETILFGVSHMTMNNSFYNVINDELKRTIEANGDRLITMDAEMDINRQKEQIRYLLDEGVQVIFINPIDVDALEPELILCKRKKVKIIAIDTQLKKQYVDFTVVSDNYHAGVLIAEDLMSKVDHANIVLLEHNGVISAEERIQGFIDTISQKERFKVVDRKDSKGQLENAMDNMNEVFEEDVDFDVVMALNDPSAMGALAALDLHGKTNVIVYGVDGAPEAKALINKGEMTGTVAQSPKTIGRMAADNAYLLLKDDNLKKTEEIIPVELIVKDTMNKYNLKGWQ